MMAEKDSQNNLVHDIMEDASMGTLGQERKDFFRMLLKNVITQQSVLDVPIHFDEKDIEFNQPFANVTMFYLNMGQTMSEKKKRNWWSKNWKLAKFTLNEMRSNITCGLKKIFYCTYHD